MKPVKPLLVVLDRPRRLAFDFNAMVYLEEYGGLNVLEGFDFGEFRTPSKLRLLLAACLYSDALDHGEELTPAKVGQLLSLEKIAEFSAQVEQLIAGALPDAPEGAAANPR